MTTLFAIITDLLILAALSGLGFLITKLILGNAGGLELASLSFPVGSGTFTWLLFLLSWAGIPLTLTTIGLTYAAAFTVIALSYLRFKSTKATTPRISSSDDADHRRNLYQRGLWLLLILFLGIVIPLAIGRSHSRWDAAAGWIIKGYGIALEGDIRAAEDWGAWRLAYPLNIPLQVMLFRIINGDVLPGSILPFPIYAFSLAVGLFRLWRRDGVNGWISLIGVAIFVTNPLVLLHSTIGYTNLPLTTHIVLATFWIIEGLKNDQPRSLLMGSFLFGLASWTRAEAVGYGLSLIAVVILAFRLLTKNPIRLVHTVVPFAIMSGSWFLFGWSEVAKSHLGGAVRGVLPKLQAGEYQLRHLYLIPRLLLDRALDIEQWGVLFPIVGLLCIIGLIRLFKPRKYPQFIATLFATMVACTIPVGLFYIRSFTRPTGFSAFLNRSFDRAFLPGAIMLLALGFLIVYGGRSSQLPHPAPDGEEPE